MSPRVTSQLIGPRMRLDARMSYHRASGHQGVSCWFVLCPRIAELCWTAISACHCPAIFRPAQPFPPASVSPERRSFDLELVSQRELHYARLGDRPGILSERGRIRECAIESDGRGIEPH
jgi:hypothetical protein